MSRARTWRWRRMRRYGELSSGVERSSPRQFFPDYTIAMRGYDFREGQYPYHRRGQWDRAGCGARCCRPAMWRNRWCAVHSLVDIFVSCLGGAQLPSGTLCNGLGTLWTGFCEQIEARGSKPPMAGIAVISFVPVLRDLERRQRDCGRECNQVQLIGEKDCDPSR